MRKRKPRIVIEVDSKAQLDKLHAFARRQGRDLNLSQWARGVLFTLAGIP